MHLQCGHRERGLQSLIESVHAAQQHSDHISVTHALFWLYRATATPHTHSRSHSHIHRGSQLHSQADQSLLLLSRCALRAFELGQYALCGCASLSLAHLLASTDTEHVYEGVHEAVWALLSATVTGRVRSAVLLSHTQHTYSHSHSHTHSHSLSPSQPNVTNTANPSNNVNNSSNTANVSSRGNSSGRGSSQRSCCIAAEMGVMTKRHLVAGNVLQCVSGCADLIGLAYRSFLSCVSEISEYESESENVSVSDVIVAVSGLAQLYLTGHTHKTNSNSNTIVNVNESVHIRSLRQLLTVKSVVHPSDVGGVWAYSLSLILQHWCMQLGAVSSARALGAHARAASRVVSVSTLQEEEEEVCGGSDVDSIVQSLCLCLGSFRYGFGFGVCERSLLRSQSFSCKLLRSHSLTHTRLYPHTSLSHSPTSCGVLSQVHLRCVQHCVRVLWAQSLCLLRNVSHVCVTSALSSVLMCVSVCERYGSSVAIASAHILLALTFLHMGQVHKAQQLLHVRTH